jgi:antirestriction protein ArdC
MSGREQGSVLRYKRAAAVIRSSLHLQNVLDWDMFSTCQLQHLIDAFAGLVAEADKRHLAFLAVRRERSLALALLLYGNGAEIDPSMPLAIEHRQLRHVVNDDEIFRWLSGLFADLGSELACTVGSSLPACRLQDERFTAVLENWRRLLGNDRFVTFVCGSVACRLQDEQFTAVLENWRRLLGDDRFATFVCDSVACRLQDEQFTAVLENWRRLLGNDRFVTFVCGSVACRLQDEQFTAVLENWRRLLGDDRFATFVCDSVACRLQNEQFTAVLENWRGLLGNDRFATFVCDSVARRLQDEQFTATLESWRRVLGDQAFVTFVCNSVARRLHDELFTAALESWRRVLGDARFVTFVCNSVACRLQDERFTDTAERWLRLLFDDTGTCDAETFTSFLSQGGVASRICEPEWQSFFNKVEEQFRVGDRSVSILLLRTLGRVSKDCWKWMSRQPVTELVQYLYSIWGPGTSRNERINRINSAVANDLQLLPAESVSARAPVE